ncbi:MAG: molybdenum cofactor guanylyltransferase [archaeon]|nr:molybdenum cofactor guanylyltransferase [archaeon]MCP8314730.1 molybdenum cofactor guanylyltransferase [archaeon]MCP8316090.1 molybdenum cofactor guanylyltransferase [archaeon]MCP8319887.1 molybdenum cofactor guanylyltransferase [archaeon]
MKVGVAILSGGESRRFQKPGYKKRDKALEILDGKRMIEWVIDTAYQVSDKVAVVVRDEEQVKSYSEIFSKNYPNLGIISDMEGFGHSPLVGLATSARIIEDDLILVLPCDTPYVKKDVPKLLIDKAKDFDAVSPLWPDGKIEPLITVYRREHVLLCYPALLSLKRWRPDDIIRGSRKSYLINVENIREIDKELNSFFNINYPEDIKIKKRIKLSNGIKEDKMIYPNKVAIEKIKEVAKAISNKDLNPKLIDDLKNSYFWLSMLAISLYDKFGKKWLDLAGRSFEDEANYYIKEEVRMLALHAMLDSLSCWKGLSSMNDVNRLSKEVMNLKRHVGIDFEGRYLK